ncbi:hypothetical protein SERLADRAFT_457861 [Serpula lacrymans var. lacrymans S7.9]|uniref:Uncharacterized protein n=1 Tax=Serpula lacrymans var. lacrymans (strain S7.9) TaxID=578457 RepID=F8NHY5_SERL9|nr:uncharacterized protein SERLADRAFT_457861 [Serpula lacrymans var. lacrymans S7.9]EGO29707.1 hypothetical protein SERLADRAFT_457861 [Serpula lacrymans var. lacrymans S7.9]
MSVRSFTVFQDTPTEIEVTKNESPCDNDNNSPAISAAAAAASVLSTLAAIEKENLHPVTGERAGPGPTCKKRKTGVLVAKVDVFSSTSKKQKEAKPETKKRKSSISSSKGKSGGKKDGTGKPMSRSTRRVSPLPKVEEEIEAQKEQERISQANVESKCYELTVLPLADVSQAYETSPLLEPKQQKSVIEKESSVEPEFDDCFSSPHLQTSLPSDRRTTVACGLNSSSFSTPERKRIYAAFTFSSPSPASERFNKTHSPVKCAA